MKNKPALTTADVQKMAAACKAEAAKNKWGVTIAITDDAGYLFWEDRIKERPAFARAPVRAPIQGGVPIMVVANAGVAALDA